MRILAAAIVSSLWRTTAVSGGSPFGLMLLALAEHKQLFGLVL